MLELFLTAKKIRNQFKKLIADEQKRERLPEDTFSFLAMSTGWPQTSYALVTFLAQVVILTMILLDLIWRVSGIGVPADIEFQVRVAQPVALVIAVWMEADILTTLELLKDQAYSSLKPIDGNAKPSYEWWFFAHFLRLLEGCYTLCISFILVAQSKEVLELFLNFAAVHFVSELDNLAFSIAYKGFLWSGLQTAAKDVKKAEYYTKENAKKTIATRVVVVLAILGLYGGWIFITYKQIHSDYIIKRYVVEFEGDEFVYDENNKTYIAEVFDGLYTAKNGSESTLRGRKTKNGRVAFYEDKWNEALNRPRGVFAYCDQRWAFGLVGPDVKEAHRLTPCMFDVYSSKVESSFQLSDASALSWSFGYDIKIQEAECDASENVKSNSGIVNRQCKFRGKCENKSCVCHGNWTGVFCELQKSTCKSLTTALERGDQYRFGGVPNNKALIKVRPVFRRQKRTIVNKKDGIERPVYQDEQNEGRLLVYLESRWVLTDFYSPGIKRSQLLAESVQNFTNSHWASYPLCPDCEVFVSERTKNLSPEGISWFRYIPSLSERVPYLTRFADGQAKFDCYDGCDDTATSMPCRNEGVCNLATGSCECQSSFGAHLGTFTGVRCDIPCEHAVFRTSAADCADCKGCSMRENVIADLYEEEKDVQDDLCNGNEASHRNCTILRENFIGKLPNDTTLDLAKEWIRSEDTRNVCTCTRKMRQRFYLATLYLALGGPESQNSSGWIKKGGWLKGGDECNWHGVHCVGNVVVSLNLSGNRLQGDFPSTIGPLTSLGALDLSNNTIGGKIPAAIQRLTKLVEMDLGDNQIGLRFPIEIGKLTKLERLNLRNNTIRGVLPSELWKLTNLTSLDVSNNLIQGPLSSDVGKLKNLASLNVSNNKISGQLPSELGNMSKAEELYLQKNQLNGTVPSEIANAISLRESLESGTCVFKQTQSILCCNLTSLSFFSFKIYLQ